jgi:hypothetical protein
MNGSELAIPGCFEGFIIHACFFLCAPCISSAVSIVPSFRAQRPCRLWMRRFGWVEVAASDGDECVHRCTRVVEGWRGPGGAHRFECGGVLWGHQQYVSQGLLCTCVREVCGW